MQTLTPFWPQNHLTFPPPISKVKFLTVAIMINTSIKATREDLNANFRILFWPPLVASTIWAEPSQDHGFVMV